MIRSPTRRGASCGFDLHRTKDNLSCNGGPRRFISCSQQKGTRLVRVLAVNNYPSAERFDRLRACLEETGAVVTITDRVDCSALFFNEFDGVALSGSPDMLSSSNAVQKYAPELDSIRDVSVPILGVCFGHQLIAVAFGSRVIKAPRPVLGFVNTKLLVDDPLFSGIPRSTMLLESRHEIVKSLPKGFDLLATSTRSRIAAMKHRLRPIYGVQSHPERFTIDNPYGKTLIGNFVRSLT
jgi:GMP synthase-like glutamine amidotransferase